MWMGDPLFTCHAVEWNAPYFEDLFLQTRDTAIIRCIPELVYMMQAFGFLLRVPAHRVTDGLTGVGVVSQP
jgi:hypothetical protein